MLIRSAHSQTRTRTFLLTGLLSVLSLASLPAKGHDDAGGEGQGAVFALTNAPSGNAVVAYNRAADGSLTFAGTYATGGTGTGAGLMSQGAVVATDDRRFVVAVNPGSDSISVFRIRQDGLQLIDTEPSGGDMPTSVAVRGGLVVVVNAGAPDNITGFRLGPHGGLSPINGFTAPLSASQSGPGQVAFSQDGDTLIVTERATNLISTFLIDDDRLDGPYPTPSAGPTPFGFAVGHRNMLLVSEAGVGGGASTYRVRGRELDVVSSAIMTGQRAACWAVLTPNGRFGYVSNAGTGTITAFAIRPNGSAVQLNPDGVTAITGGNPTDMAMSANGRYLYVRVANLAAIAVFRVEHNGSLTALPSLEGTPAGLAGLAGF